MAFEHYDYALALWLVPRRVRPKLQAVFALDRRLQHVAHSAREPLLAQIKLAWWREQLTALDTGVVSAEPQIQALFLILSPTLTGTMLSGLTDDVIRAQALTDVMTALCGSQPKALRLLSALAADDAARTAAHRPLASPAHRTLIALRIVLIGR